MLGSSLKSAVVGLGLVGGLASQASAVPLFDSHGFEPSTTAAINYQSNLSLVGQPTAALATQQWTGRVKAGNTDVATGGNNNFPLSGVFPFASGANTQYALLQAVNNTPGSFGFFYPKTNLTVAEGGTGNVTPAAPNRQVAITFSMNVYSGYGTASATNDEFFGVTAVDGTGKEIASLGLNNRTGTYVLPAGTSVTNNSPIPATPTVALGGYIGYRLLLDFGTQTYSIAHQLSPGVGAFVNDATGAFVNATTTFAHADLAAFNLGTGVANGNAGFDDYLVQTVPEPTSLTVAGLAVGLLAGRRRRMI